MRQMNAKQSAAVSRKRQQKLSHGRGPGLSQDDQIDHYFFRGRKPPDQIDYYFLRAQNHLDLAPPPVLPICVRPCSHSYFTTVFQCFSAETICVYTIRANELEVFPPRKKLTLFGFTLFGHSHYLGGGFTRNETTQNFPALRGHKNG